MNDKATKILIVDDNPTNIDLLRKFLAHGNYQLSAVTSGIKALTLVEKNPPDLILLDVMMPELDGYQTCTQLKTNPKTQHIPVIFVTAKVSPEDIRQGFKVGGADYISKPAHQAEVLARVNNQVQVIEKNLLAKAILMKSEKMSGLGNLVAGIAHEIASPLGTLNLALDVLNEEFFKIKQAFDTKDMTAAQFGRFLHESHEAMAIASRNIENAKQIMQSFKLIAVDQCNNRMSQIELKPYIESVLLSIRPLLKSTQHQIALEIPEYVNLELNAGALSQVLINLINNSIIHGFEHITAGKITCHAVLEQQHLVLTYQDNGCGIKDELTSKIFEQYFTTKADSGGSGLGLYLVKHLVETELNGSISMQSTVGQGTEFSIRLPLQPMVKASR
jgi:signal transduction histidine kinase